MSKVIVESQKRITNHFSTKHQGVDLGWRVNERENKVYAHSKGKVIMVVNEYDIMPGSVGMKSYGNYVDIEHENGYKTRYAHLKKNSILVKIGDRVAENTVIGIMGTSGNAYGRHLHFEVLKNNIRINPEPYLTEDFKNKNTIMYQSHDEKYKWNPNVIIGTKDYAGNFGIPIDGIYLDKYRMRVHDMTKMCWLPWVKDRNDYAGNLGNMVDGVQIEQVVYRVHLKNGSWLSWVEKVDDTPDGYAGIYGKPIDAIQIKEKK